MSGSASVEWGDFYSGTRRDLSVIATVRPWRGISLDTNGSWSRLELAEGSVPTAVVQTKTRHPAQPLDLVQQQYPVRQPEPGTRVAARRRPRQLLVGDVVSRQKEGLYIELERQRGRERVVPPQLEGNRLLLEVPVQVAPPEGRLVRRRAGRRHVLGRISPLAELGLERALEIGRRPDIDAPGDRVVVAAVPGTGRRDTCVRKHVNAGDRAR